LLEANEMEVKKWTILLESLKKLSFKVVPKKFLKRG